MKDRIRETFHPPMSIRQETIDAIRKHAGLKILHIDGIRKIMRPVIQHYWHGIVFGMKKLIKFDLARGKALERATTRWGRVYHQWSSDSIVIVGLYMGMVPVEAILVFGGEAVGEVCARKDGILRQKHKLHTAQVCQ